MSGNKEVQQAQLVIGMLEVSKTTDFKVERAQRLGRTGLVVVV